MKQMQLFHSKLLEEYFSNYKIIFYLLVTLIFAFSILSFVSFEKKSSYKKVLIKDKKIDIKKEKKVIPILLIEDIEKYIKQNSLKLLSLKLMKNSFYLQIESSYINSLKLIDFIEKYSGYLLLNKIVVINDYLKNNIKLDVNVLITNNITKYKKDNNLQTLEPSFIKNKKINKKEVTKNDEKLDLSAIVNDKVLINNKWYKKSDYIKNNKILEIKRDFIILQKESNKFYLRLYENEFIR